MSWGEKFGTMLQKPNDDLVSKDDIPWWQKAVARCVGTVAGGAALFFGVFNAIFSVFSFSITYMAATVWLALLGFIVLIFEAPFCCMFVDFVQEGSKWVEDRPYWQRAAFYMLGSAIPAIMGNGLTFYASCVLVFVTGLLYGSMALGKKAPREEMRNNAATVYSPNQQFPPAASSKSNLVEGAQPVASVNPFSSYA